MPQQDNGDEASLPGFIGSFSKGLPHNASGEVDPQVYADFQAALMSGDLSRLERSQRRLPQARKPCGGDLVLSAGS